MNPFDRLQLDFKLPLLPYAREIVRYTWRVYRQNLGMLALVASITVLPFEYLISYLWAPFSFEHETMTVKAVYIGSMFLVGIMGTLLIPVTTHNLIGWMRSGENPPLRESFDFGINLWPRTVWIRMVAGLGIMGAALLLVVPGILLWYSWLFAEVIVAVENLSSVRDILRRSSELTNGYRMDMCVAMLLAGIPFAAFGWATDYLNKTFPHWAVEASLSGVGVIANQYFVCLILVCYLDRRRHEEAAIALHAGA